MATIGQTELNVMAQALQGRLTNQDLVLSGTGVTVTFSSVLFGSSGNQVTANGTPISAQASGSGTITAFDLGGGRIVGTVGTQGGDMIMNPTTVADTQTVNLNSFVLTILEITV